MNTLANPTKSTSKAGRVLYEEMVKDFDYSQINWTIRRYNNSISEADANQMIDAFLQWISLTPRNTREIYMVMFKTPVEEAFHNFVLNTRIYQVFCEKFLGYFFHHDPMVQETGPEVERIAKYTVEMLETNFGSDLNPLLKDWRRQFEDGTYHVACAGPGGSC
jgi:hypothetical protein